MSEPSTETRVILERVTTVLEFLRDGHEDHEARLREQAERTRQLEMRPTGITPKQLLASAAAVAGIAATVIPLVSAIR